MEIGIVKSQNQARIDTFRETLDLQNMKTEEKKAREAYQNELDETLEKARQVED